MAKSTKEQIEEFKERESKAEDYYDFSRLADDIGETGDKDWAWKLFEKAEGLAEDSMDYYLIVESLNRLYGNSDKDRLRNLLEKAEKLADGEFDLKRILTSVKTIIKDENWALVISEKIEKPEKKSTLDEDMSESEKDLELGLGPFTIFYERHSSYTSRDEMRRAKIELVESKSVDALLEIIENDQNFLTMREDDVIDFSHSDNIQETGFNIIYIRDVNGNIIYPNDDVIPASRSKKSNTIAVNYQFGYPKDLYELKQKLLDQLRLLERVFFAPVTQVEFLAGWDTNDFDSKDTNAIASFLCERSNLDNFENLINDNIKGKIKSEWDTIQKMIDDGGFCINYYLDDPKFDIDYDYLHKLMPKFLELVSHDAPSINILHIPSVETLSIDDAPDIMGSLMDKFLNYV